MRFSEILNRITGLRCPVFGISWDPTEDNRNIARRIILFLEAKREGQKGYSVFCHKRFAGSGATTAPYLLGPIRNNKCTVQIIQPSFPPVIESPDHNFIGIKIQ